MENPHHEAHVVADEHSNISLAVDSKLDALLAESQLASHAPSHAPSHPPSHPPSRPGGHIAHPPPKHSEELEQAIIDILDRALEDGRFNAGGDLSQDDSRGSFGADIDYVLAKVVDTVTRPSILGGDSSRFEADRIGTPSSSGNGASSSSNPNLAQLRGTTSSKALLSGAILSSNLGGRSTVTGTASFRGRPLGSNSFRDRFAQKDPATAALEPPALPSSSELPEHGESTALEPVVEESGQLSRAPSLMPATTGDAATFTEEDGSNQQTEGGEQPPPPPPALTAVEEEEAPPAPEAERSAQADPAPTEPSPSTPSKPKLAGSSSRKSTSFVDRGSPKKSASSAHLAPAADLGPFEDTADEETRNVEEALWSAIVRGETDDLPALLTLAAEYSVPPSNTYVHAAVVICNLQRLEESANVTIAKRDYRPLPAILEAIINNCATGVDPMNLQAGKDFAKAEKAVEILEIDRQVQEAIFASDQQALGVALTRAERLGFGSILRRAQILENIADNRAKVHHWLLRKEEQMKREAKERKKQKMEALRAEAEEVRRKEEAARLVYLDWKRQRDADLRQSKRRERTQQQAEIRGFLEREAEVTQRSEAAFVNWLRTKAHTTQQQRDRAALHFKKSQRHLEAIKMGQALERKAYRMLEGGWDQGFVVANTLGTEREKELKAKEERAAAHAARMAHSKRANSASMMGASGGRSSMGRPPGSAKQAYHDNSYHQGEPSNASHHDHQLVEESERALLSGLSSNGTDEYRTMHYAV